MGTSQLICLPINTLNNNAIVFVYRYFQWEQSYDKINIVTRTKGSVVTGICKMCFDDIFWPKVINN